MDFCDFFRVWTDIPNSADEYFPDFEESFRNMRTFLETGQCVERNTVNIKTK